jgi:predicted MFS family arabinose efflux permease
MIPLVGDFAPAKRRGASLSVVVSGLLFGMLIARFFAGVITNFTSWRNIYWFACGAQYLLVLLLYVFMPDYPSTNPGDLSYFRALWSIPYFLITEPVLVQACLIMFTLSTSFTSFWTTLTFLLASPPYEYSSLVIGLFSLISIVAMILVPLYGRVIDRFVPLFSLVIALFVVLVGVIVGTFTGTMTVAGPIIQGIGIDIGVQTAQVANRASIFSINPKARNRLNTAYMAAVFSGQLTGTAIGNRLYAAGGWTRSGACSSMYFLLTAANFGLTFDTPVGFVSASLMFALLRGPRETRWVGWRGGWRPRKDQPPPAIPQPETEAK